MKTFVVFVAWYSTGSGWFQNHALKVCALDRDAARATVANQHPEFPDWAVRTATVEEVAA